MFFRASSGWGSVPFLANSTAPSTISCTSSSSCCQSSGGDLELLAEAHDRVALGGLVAVLLGAVDLRVADVVAVHPVGLDVEEDRAGAGAHVLERLARLLVDLRDVLAVDLDRVHVVGESPLGHVVPDRRVLPAGRRLGPLVVLADEERLGLPELRQVERLVEGAGVGRAVAEERDRDARLVAELEGEAGADQRREPAADDGVRAEVAALDVVEVHRAAVAVRAALHLPVELSHQRVRVRPARERVAVGAVGRAEDVAVLHRGADPDLGGLLADRDVQEAGQLAGAEALLDLLLEPPDQEHLAQEVAELVLGKGALLLDLGHGLSVRSRAMALVSDWQRPAGRVARGLGRGAHPRRARAPRRHRPRGRAARAASAAPAGAGHDRGASSRAAAAAATARRPSGAALARLDAERLHGLITIASVEERAAGLPRAPPPRRSPSPGTPRSRRSRPTGATCSARSSSPRPTTSSPAR